MEIVTAQSWRAHILTTLDTNSVAVKVADHKATLLQEGLEAGGYYLMTIEAGFDVEIVKIVMAHNGILTLERGQQGTMPGIWPAGTPMDARISLRTVEDLRLDLGALLSCNDEVFLAPNGDVITKTYHKVHFDNFNNNFHNF